MVSLREYKRFSFFAFPLEFLPQKDISSIAIVAGLGNRLMVGHRTLTPFVQVRILVPQVLK